MSLNHTLKSVIGNAEDTVRSVGMSDVQKVRMHEEKESLRTLGDTRVSRAIMLMTQVASMAISAQGQSTGIKLTK